MQIFLLIASIATALLLVTFGVIDEDSKNGKRQRSKFLIAAGFGFLALAGLVAYNTGEGGIFGIGVSCLLGLTYLVRALRKD